MKLLTELDSLDNVKDGETRKLISKTSSSGSGNVVSSVSVSGDTITYTKGVTALTAHQNAFSNVKVGSTTVAADSAGDTLELVAGSNVTLTPDATNDKVTIAATDTTYESKAAASGGTAVSLVTTGEKYTWNNKQNALSTQTAYSAKGTATKVPQITTNTLGQVTSISEVTITQPTVNNGTLTIQKNGTNVQTFSANQGSNVTANITVPTKTSELTNDSGYTSNTGTITGVSVNGTSIATSGVANITSVPASILSGAIPSAVTATTQSAGDNSTKIATTAFVKTAIDNLPDPMVFKGSLGTDGTITALPVDGSANIGDTYKVITAGTYASKAAKVGDTFICLTKTSSANTWELIPSGDEPSGTVTSITLKATSPIAIDSSSAITTSGTRTISHGNSGVTAGTYRSVTVNATGHVTAGTNPTTLSGYGITDAKIANGVITLGSNTITPLTAHQDISGKYDKSGGAITGAITRSLASSGTIAATNLFTVTGSTDGFKVDYAATTADKGVTTLYTTDDADAKISIGNTVSSTYKEAISVTNGSATINGYVPAAASAKAVDTSIAAASTSANLPTSAAVAAFVEGKGYKTTDNDTKNTAGSTDSSSKLFLIGATSQAANPQTYSHDTAYVGTDGHLYSNSVQVVNLSGSQALTNKTYNGYTLAAACAKGVVTSVDTSANLPTSNAVKTFVEGKGYTTNTGTITGITMNGASKGTSGVVDLGTVSTTDTKNTAGSTDTSSKIFLIGATSQATNPQTYSDNEIYATSGVLTTKSVQVGGTAATMQYNSTDKCIEFIFA